MTIKSLTTLENPFNSAQEIREWIARRNCEVTVNVEQIPFSEMMCWYSEEDGSIHHDSGIHFSIVGIDVQTNYGTNNHWRQPIIDQLQCLTDRVYGANDKPEFYDYVMNARPEQILIDV